jgi:hypothetical protein
MKTELCSFSGYKIHPGFGTRYIRLDAKVFHHYFDANFINILALLFQVIQGCFFVSPKEKACQTPMDSSFQKGRQEG